jgi:imidazoleglycerol-phosphate dehydratase
MEPVKAERRHRAASIFRKTKEVVVRGRMDLDGCGKADVKTGIPFLDHMLTLMAQHGLFDLSLKAKGDLEVDRHHTNEDVGLALGEAVRMALGNKRGIRRMGSAFVPMDETLARVRVVVDASGRPHLSLNWGPARRLAMPSHYSKADAAHFLKSFVMESGLTLHVDVLKAEEDIHHLLEAIFKALGRSLRQAVERDPRVKGIPSTKGRLG